MFVFMFICLFFAGDLVLLTEFINVNWLPLRKFSQTFTNPLIPMSDQDRISPYNINTILTR